MYYTDSMASEWQDGPCTLCTRRSRYSFLCLVSYVWKLYVIEHRQYRVMRAWLWVRTEARGYRELSGTVEHVGCKCTTIPKHSITKAYNYGTEVKQACKWYGIFQQTTRKYKKDLTVHVLTACRIKDSLIKGSSFITRAWMSVHKLTDKGWHTWLEISTTLLTGPRFQFEQSTIRNSGWKYRLNHSLYLAENKYLGQIYHFYAYT